MGEQKGTFSAQAGGFTAPNASCPVCGASVFFYQSPYGGRVYFDSLGPPWPKHPCTTHEYLASSDPSRNDDYLGWYREGWKPLTNVSIAPGPNSGIYKLTGRCNDWSHRQFYLAADELVMCEIVRFKPRVPGEFYISILDYDTINHRWQTWSGIAYVLAENAATNVGILQKSIFPGEAIPPKPKEYERAQFPEKAVSPTAAHTFTSPQNEDPFQRCPVCEQKVLKKNLRKHIRRVHNNDLTPLNLQPMKRKKRRKGTISPETVSVTIRKH